MNTFYDLLKQSVLVQAMITLIIISTICYMYIVGQEVPNDLINIAVLIIGFYFGSKTQQRMNGRVSKNEDSINHYTDRRH